MNHRVALATLVLVLALSGCAEERIDASSEAALRRSIGAVRDELDGTEQKRFDSLVASAVAKAVLSDLRGERRSLIATLADYDGMTGREVLAHHAETSQSGSKVRDPRR